MTIDTATMSGDKAILVVEDEQHTLETLDARLSREGFKIIPAINAEIALELAMNHHPDLILLTILLPEMDGMDMLQKLRKDEWGANVPVILLSNLDYPDDLIFKAIENRVSDHLIKADLRLGDLVLAIKERLSFD
jgi:DNA-binding response OmpR family regulator